MTFTPIQQDKHRKAFIDECRQKAWGAACHAEWIGKQIDGLSSEYERLGAQQQAIADEIKTLKGAIDSHTKDNREKRKELQEKRDALMKGMAAISANLKRGHQAMQELYAAVESGMALAGHAEGWSWKEAQQAPQP